MTHQPSFDRYRALRLAGVVFGLSLALGACTETTGSVATTALPPEDYRLRHPITVQEAEHSIVIFVGHARGGLSATQRADVAGLARMWAREGTGAIAADVPVEPVAPIDPCPPPPRHCATATCVAAMLPATTPTKKTKAP